MLMDCKCPFPLVAKYRCAAPRKLNLQSATLKMRILDLLYRIIFATFSMPVFVRGFMLRSMCSIALCGSTGSSSSTPEAVISLFAMSSASSDLLVLRPAAMCHTPSFPTPVAERFRKAMTGLRRSTSERHSMPFAPKRLRCPPSCEERSSETIDSL